MLSIEPTAIPDVKIVVTRRFVDDRGFFTETWQRRRFAEAGLDLDFVQENHSLSILTGTIRGLHFQSPPYEQAKLVRVVRGSILDVAVDLRRSSPTYGRHIGVTLSAEDGRQLLVPVGFAHGFCTMQPNTEVIYKATNCYSLSHDHGVAFDDSALAIRWPSIVERFTLSEKDRQHPRLSEIRSYFD
jgi:dTDP-4-dehydrorhamnose 3,5-epimerase